MELGGRGRGGSRLRRLSRENKSRIWEIEDVSRDVALASGSFCPTFGIWVGGGLFTQQVASHSLRKGSGLPYETTSHKGCVTNHQGLALGPGWDDPRRPLLWWQRHPAAREGAGGPQGTRICRGCCSRRGAHRVWGTAPEYWAGLGGLWSGFRGADEGTQCRHVARHSMGHMVGAPLPATAMTILRSTQHGGRPCGGEVNRLALKRQGPAVCPWAGHLTSLSLSFPSCEMGEVTVRSKEEKVWSAPSTGQALANWWPRPLSLLTGAGPRPRPAGVGRRGHGHAGTPAAPGHPPSPHCRSCHVPPSVVVTGFQVSSCRQG